MFYKMTLPSPPFENSLIHPWYTKVVIGLYRHQELVAEKVLTRYTDRSIITGRFFGFSLSVVIQGPFSF